MMPPPIRLRAHIHAAVLVLLLAAFACRVLAQLVQALVPVDGLLPFDAWAAGAMPYPLLLTTQALVIVAGVAVIRGLARGRVRARRGWAVALLAAGALYFAVMAFRLVAGLTFLTDNPWFAASLPAAFHLVLAGFVLTFGHFHPMNSRNAKAGASRASR